MGQVVYQDGKYKQWYGKPTPEAFIGGLSCNVPVKQQIFYFFIILTLDPRLAIYIKLKVAVRPRIVAAKR